MRFKLLVAFVDDARTDDVIEASRKAGATGVTVIPNARGEGHEPRKTFFGLELETQRDLVLLLVEAHRSRRILETIGQTAQFDTAPGAGIAVQIDVEDAIGLAEQIALLADSTGENP